MSLLCLSPDDMKQALPMPLAIDAMRIAFQSLSENRMIMPVRAHIEIPEHKGTALFMPSYISDLGNIAIKTVTLFDDNAFKNIPYIQGLVSVFDGTTGTPIAILDGTTLTAIRTGAASGLATQLLANQNASTIAVFGSGVQARTQLQAVLAVRNITTGYVYSPTFQNATRFANEMNAQFNINILPAKTPQQAVDNADVIICATVSHTPVFSDADLKPGVHINAVGSYKPHVQELPEQTVLRAKLVVDHIESAMEETGDLIIPMQNGTFNPDTMIHGELGQLVSQSIPARQSEDEITLFKSVGVAVQDLAAAAAAIKNAKALNIGQSIKW